MDELFFKWRKTLNIKKVIITSIIIITFILIVIFLTIPKESNTTNTVVPLVINNQEKNTSYFFDKNHLISLELSNNDGFKNYLPQNNYILELRNDSNLNIFISQKDSIIGRSLNDVVSADRLAYTETFSKVSNISELKELTINDRSAFTYSFHYLDEILNKTFYIQITWVNINSNYYVFDIEFPLEDLSLYTNIITDVLSSFKLL